MDFSPTAARTLRCHASCNCSRSCRIVASGTPAELTGATPATEIRYRENGREVVLETDEPTRVLHDLTARALSEQRELDGLQVRGPSLEEVYLSLTEERDE